MLDGDGGKGNGGDLVIQAADVTFTNGSLVNATTLGAGQGGSVNLQATHQIQLDGSTTSISSSSHGPGKAGFITLQGANLLLAEGADIQSTSGFGYPNYHILLSRTGSANDINIDLSDTLYMSGGSRISTATAGVGDAGNIRIGTITKPLSLIHI